MGVVRRMKELLVFATSEEVVVTAHVIHGGETRQAGLGGLRQSIDVETEEVTTEEQTQKARPEWGRDVLSRREVGQPTVGVSSLRSISEVSSASGD